MQKKSTDSRSIQWTKFAGLATQWGVALAGLIFLGKYIDQKINLQTKTPIFIWVLPFLYIIISLIRIIKETKTKSDTK